MAEPPERLGHAESLPLNIEPSEQSIRKAGSKGSLHSLLSTSPQSPASPGAPPPPPRGSGGSPRGLASGSLRRGDGALWHSSSSRAAAASARANLRTRLRRTS